MRNTGMWLAVVAVALAGSVALAVALSNRKLQQSEGRARHAQAVAAYEECERVNRGREIGNLRVQLDKERYLLEAAAWRRRGEAELADFLLRVRRSLDGQRFELSVCERPR